MEIFGTIGQMTIECKHYIFHFVKVYTQPLKDGTCVHLETLYDPESDQLGYSFLGEAEARSLATISPDNASLNTYNPNRGSMCPDGKVNSARAYKQLSGEEINKENIVSNSGCLALLIGYRRRYSWRPTK